LSPHITEPTPTDWRPAASLEILRLRAELLAKIRAFFAGRSILEVETPALSSAGVCDPHIHSLTTHLSLTPNAFYLHTSPEFAMKRLLAAGLGPIYQIARVFRDGERGRLHNPEFTLIEWYRPGFDHHALMDEVEALLSMILGTGRCERLAYGDIFRRYAGLDPHSADVHELRQHARRLDLNFPESAMIHPNDYLDLILSHCVAPRLGIERPTFVYDFPASQAALARVRQETPPVAERFELFIHGMEIANGFHELTDAFEQRRRFELEQERRGVLGLPVIPMDERLLAALAHGLPPCAGVALGFDRLVMVRAGVTDIAEVMAFPVERA
jgi:lysyl-tRNA synthetase class 2